MSCPEHQALLDRIREQEPTDEDLIRYAEEVPACPTCRRALSVQLGVHPAVLDHGGRRDLAGWVSASWLRRLRSALSPPRRSWRTGALLASAAAALMWVWVPGDTPPVRTTAWAPATETEPVSVALVRPSSPAPEVPAAPGVAPAAEPTPPPPRADDWPAPPPQDLRDQTSKGAALASGLPELSLGEATDATVGTQLPLSVVTHRPETLSVCVEGAEQGIIWRGAVPSGTTRLTLAGRAVDFQLAQAGSYRFALALGTDGCAQPLQVLPIQVRP